MPSDRLPLADIRVGMKLRDNWGAARGARGRLWHVVALIEDDDVVILRMWSPTRQGWRWICSPVRGCPDLLGWSKA